MWCLRRKTSLQIPTRQLPKQFDAVPAVKNVWCPFSGTQQPKTEMKLGVDYQLLLQRTHPNRFDTIPADLSVLSNFKKRDVQKPSLPIPHPNIKALTRHRWRDAARRTHGAKPEVQNYLVFKTQPSALHSTIAALIEEVLSMTDLNMTFISEYFGRV